METKKREPKTKRARLAPDLQNEGDRSRNDEHPKDRGGNGVGAGHEFEPILTQNGSGSTGGPAKHRRLYDGYLKPNFVTGALP
jgi:hypothetical protein